AASTFNLNVTECDSVEILNTWYYASTTFNDTIFGGAGNSCDSVVIYNVIINYSDSTFANFTTCDINDVGVVVLNFTNQFSCDSAHTVTPTILAASTFNLNVTECDSVEILNTWYYASTTFNDTIFGGAGNGCDSVVIYNVIIHYRDSTFANFTTCDINDVGVLVLNLTNQFGCDSVHTITTTLLPTPTFNLNVTECDSVEILNTWYYAST